MIEDEVLDTFPLDWFEVDCDGSVCGSAGVGRHTHEAQDGWPPVCRVRITDRCREYLPGDRNYPGLSGAWGDIMRFSHLLLRGI